MTPVSRHLAALLLPPLFLGCARSPATDGSARGAAAGSAPVPAASDDALPVHPASYDEAAQGDTIELAGRVLLGEGCAGSEPLALRVLGARSSPDARGRELARAELSGSREFRLRIARRHAAVELALDARGLRLIDPGAITTSEDRRLSLVATQAAELAGRLAADPDARLAGLELLLGSVPSAAEEALLPIREPGRWWSSYLGRTTAGADGRFEFRGVPAGVPLQLRALPAGSAPVCQAIEPLALDAPRELTLALDPGVTLEGRIVDRGGAPLPRARLELDTGSCFARRWVPQELREGPARDDPDYPEFGPRDANPAPGVFVLRDLPAGPVRLRACEPDHGSAELVLADLRAGETRRDLQLTLAEAPRIEGRVLDARGAPVAGARVCARWIDVSSTRHDGPRHTQLVGEPEPRSAGRAAARAQAAPAISDAQGRFALQRLPAGRVALSASASGASAREPRELELEAGGVARAELVLVPASDLWVELAGAPDARPAEVAIYDGERRLRAEAGPENASGAGTADERGVRCGPLPPGSYHVVARDAQGGLAEGEVTLNGSATARIALERQAAR